MGKGLRDRVQGKGIYVAIFIIIILFIWYFVANSNLYERPIKNYFDGLSRADSKIMFKALPDFARKELLKEKSYREYDKSLKTIIDDMKEEYGDNFKIKYKIIAKESIDNTDLESVANEFKKTYNTSVDITEGYKLKVDITTKGSKKEETNSLDFFVYKINNVWSLKELQNH